MSSDNATDENAINSTPLPNGVDAAVILHPSDRLSEMEIAQLRRETQASLAHMDELLADLAT